ncbi:MAG: FtsW/RodA/SpoVE family cell cycle protein [Parasporobacterium sp.]|nr:FtsW/RodA/SpoVE family cell cycle protein [Parasporobacterium sp.]
MADVFFTVSKYLILLCLVIFTIVSFRAQKDVPDELKTGVFKTQRIMVIAIHGVAFFDICLNILLGNAQLNIWAILGFYGAQLAYLLIMMLFIPRIMRFNQGINNVMSMFLAIGFIIQTRLDFSNSVKQFIIVAVGSAVLIFICVIFRKASFLKNLTWIYCIAGMALLMLVLVLSTVSRGAKLSLDLGPFSFQPLEFVKILFVLFTAGAFYKSVSFKNIILTAVCAAVHILIQVFCRDLGSAFILFFIYLLMLYVATHRFGYVILGSVAFAGAAVIAYKMFSHVRERVTIWLNPWDDINSSGYQIAQSLFAIGTGGWFGSGLFHGKPEHIPLVSKDMIISAISEEMGTIFSIFLIILCLCFTLMIFRAAMRVNNLFYKLIAFGLGVSYIVQVFLTVGGAFKFIPLTGVTLPFISSGGSSIIASMAMTGIIQAVYLLSEADVAMERKMVASGADIYEFAGYEDLAEDTDEYDEPYPDVIPENYRQGLSSIDEHVEEYYSDDNIPDEYQDEYPEEPVRINRTIKHYNSDDIRYR